MRTIHRFLLMSFALGQAACVPDAFFAETPDTGGSSGSAGGSGVGSGGAGSSSGAGSGSGSGTVSGSSSGTVTGSGDRGSGAGACAIDSDCSPKEICGFQESLSCAATGGCFPAPTVTCAAYELG